MRAYGPQAGYKNISDFSRHGWLKIRAEAAVTGATNSLCIFTRRRNKGRMLLHELFQYSLDIIISVRNEQDFNPAIFRNTRLGRGGL